MDVVIIGTGNVAHCLARSLQPYYSIKQIYGRNEAAAKQLAQLLNTAYTNQMNALNTNADVYIIAVSDDAIEAVTHQLPKLKKGIVVHTAGAIASTILKNVANCYGVLYPLQSLKLNADPIPKIPFLITASNDQIFQTLNQLVQPFAYSTEKATDVQRKQYHLAAVLVSNFVNHLYRLADDFCKEHDLSFSTLQPLIQHTAQRIRLQTPSQCQTGPAIRRDMKTINNHLEMLQHDEALKKIYEVLTLSIQEKNPQ